MFMQFTKILSLSEPTRTADRPELWTSLLLVAREHTANLQFLPRCMRSSHEKAVRLSVFPSVKRVDCDKTKESSAHILATDYKKSLVIVF